MDIHLLLYLRRKTRKRARRTETDGTEEDNKSTTLTYMCYFVYNLCHISVIYSCQCCMFFNKSCSMYLPFFIVLNSFGKLNLWSALSIGSSWVQASCNDYQNRYSTFWHTFTMSILRLRNGKCAWFSLIKSGWRLRRRDTKSVLFGYEKYWSAVAVPCSSYNHQIKCY